MDIDLAFQTADDLFRTVIPPEGGVTPPLLTTVWNAPAIDPREASASIMGGAASLGAGAADAVKRAASSVSDTVGGFLSKLKWGVILLPVVLLVGLYFVMRIMSSAQSMRSGG